MITQALPGGDYLIEIAPTNGTVGGGSFELSVTFSTAAKVHKDVKKVGNTGNIADGMNLAQFLSARGTLAKSKSTARSDPSDPTSPTHPWLPFTADWCSVPSQGLARADQARRAARRTTNPPKPHHAD